MRTITINVPAKLVVSENGAAPNQPQQSSSSEIGRLLKADTSLVVWLIFFTIGGGVLALYYARIGYLPEMEWKAALVYLFVGSMIGGTVGLLLTISLVIPGVIWSEFIIFEPDFGQCLSYDSKDNEASSKESSRKEVCMRSMIKYLGLPFLVVLLLSHLGLWLRLPTSLPNGAKDPYLVIVAVLLFLTFCVMRSLFACLVVGDGWREFWSILKTRKLDVILSRRPSLTDTQHRQVFKYAFWFTLAVLLNQISMYLIYRLSDRPREKFAFLILTILCTAGVLINTHAVAALYRQHSQKAVVASLVAAMLLLFTADNFSSLSMRLMNHFGIGGSQKFDVLLKNDGLRIISDQDLECEDSRQYLCDVEILSKMGDQYFLSVGGKANITLPKSDVVFMIRVDQLKRTKRAKNQVDVGEIRQ